MSCKGFAAGLVTGTIIGATVGMLTDPVSDKCHRRMRKSKEKMFKTFSGMLDDMLDR